MNTQAIEPIRKVLALARMTLIEAHAANRGVGPAQDDVAQLEAAYESDGE